MGLTEGAGEGMLHNCFNALKKHLLKLISKNYVSFRIQHILIWLDGYAAI